MISKNLQIVRRRIEQAARQAGRQARDIALVCVTKATGIPRIKEILAEGVSDIGESRIQDAALKFKAIGRQARWHLIGHLQTNKAKEAVAIFDLIHSVDSLRLAEEISKQASKISKEQEVLIEVNTSGEASKYGVTPEEALPLVRKTALLPNVKVVGLMTIAPVVSDSREAKPYFKRLRLISQEISGEKIDNVVMRYLSMGMTQDFEAAIDEGANNVRIGQAIFKPA